MLDRFESEGLVLLGNQWFDPSTLLPVGVPDENGETFYIWMTPDERHEYWWEQEARHHHVACARVAVARVREILPDKWFNHPTVLGRPEPCCRAVIEHDVEAFFTCDGDKERGVPDLYVTHCKCGRKHRRFMLGGSIGSGVKQTEPRPMWRTDNSTMGLFVGVNQ